MQFLGLRDDGMNVNFSRLWDSGGGGVNSGASDLTQGGVAPSDIIYRPRNSSGRMAVDVDLKLMRAARVKMD
jgi:hypothetical protein